MDTRFILPAALAATFHTFVLFGFNWDHIPTPVLTERHQIELKPPFDPKDDTDVADVPDKTTENVKKGNPEEVIRGPDDSITTERPDFPIPRETPSKNPVKIVGSIPVGPWGDPNGIEGGDAARGPVIPSTLLDNHPRATAQVAPMYPSEMKRQGIEGTVVVAFVVDESGRVTNLHVVKSSDPAFDEPTLRAVASWRFEPGRRNNHTVRYRMTLPVDYKLNN